MRIDKALVSRGLCPSRTRAQRLLEAGLVLLNGHVCTKPSQTVEDKDQISLHRAIREGHSSLTYVSRAAAKLMGAYEAFATQGLADPSGQLCLDIGASTGGFTQVLLEKGGKKVIALDVGHDQLDPLLAADPRVIPMNGVNFREVKPEDLPFLPSYAVSDVSFISLSFIIPPLAQIARAFLEHSQPGPDKNRQIFTAILLIKPQFEVGKGKLGKGGIVRSDSLRKAAVTKILSSAQDEGFEIRGLAPSPVEGSHGNQEYLMWITVDNMPDNQRKFNT